MKAQNVLAAVTRRPGDDHADRHVGRVLRDVACNEWSVSRHRSVDESVNTWQKIDFDEQRLSSDHRIDDWNVLLMRQLVKDSDLFDRVVLL